MSEEFNAFALYEEKQGSKSPLDVFDTPYVPPKPIVNQRWMDPETCSVYVFTEQGYFEPDLLHPQGNGGAIKYSPGQDHGLMPMSKSQPQPEDVPVKEKKTRKTRKKKSEDMLTIDEAQADKYLASAYSASKHFEDICNFAEVNGVTRQEVAGWWAGTAITAESVNAEDCDRLEKWVHSLVMDRQNAAKRKEYSEPEPAVPAIIKRDDDLLIDENGEVVNPELLAQLLGMSVDKAMAFRVSDQQSAEWFIEKMVSLQSRMNTVSEMATLMINELLRYYAGMFFKYGMQLRSIVQPELESDLNKEGKPRKKSKRYLTGAVFFVKEGGYRLRDKEELQKSIDELPQEKLDLWIEAGLVTIVRKVDVAKLTKLIKLEQVSPQPGYEKLPVHEFGKMSLGTKASWSPAKLKKIVSAIKIDKGLLVREEEDDEIIDVEFE